MLLDAAKMTIRGVIVAVVAAGNLLVSCARTNPTTVADLEMAIVAGEDSVVARFLEQGGDPNTVFEQEGWTMLHRAAMHNKPQIARMLLRAGADRDKKDNIGQIALLYALIDGHSEICNLLERTSRNKGGSHFINVIHSVLYSCACYDTEQSLKSVLLPDCH